MTPSYAEPTIVEVVTPWCGGCRSMRSDIAATAAAHEGKVDFVVVDATETPEVARTLGITGTPTILGYRDSTEVFRVLGRRSRAELDQLFADVATGSDRSTRSSDSTDRILRLTAGLAVGTIGAVSGPTWALMALGAGLVVWGFRPSADATR